MMRSSERSFAHSGTRTPFVGKVYVTSMYELHVRQTLNSYTYL
jgi:hypothetical protein